MIYQSVCFLRSLIRAGQRRLALVEKRLQLRDQRGDVAVDLDENTVEMFTATPALVATLLACASNRVNSGMRAG